MKMFLFIFSLCAIGAAVALSHDDPKPIQTVPYTVNQGDTVYDIATRIATPKDNINELSHMISRINGISNGYIQPGQVIYVPVRNEK